jgi:hypothetical protein
VKSETNSIHGTAYAFGWNDAWDASNYFAGRVPMALEQYGANVGGHIVKDKLFYFLGFEDPKYTVGDSATATIPPDFPTQLSATQDPGNKLTWFDACTALGRAKVDPLSALVAGLPAGSCVPQPATSTFENAWPFDPNPTNGAAVSIAPALLTVNPIPNGIAKLDYNISPTNHLSGMYFKNYANSIIQGSSGQLEPRFLNTALSNVEDINGA